MNETKNKTVNVENKDVVFYGTKDIARMLCCSIPTARDIMHRPDFPLLTVGKSLKVSKPAFEHWTMKRRA